MNIPRKLIALLLSALTLLTSRSQPVSGNPEYYTAEAALPTVSLDISTSAGSAVLLDASGSAVRTLWEQNADQRRGPASTTKIMTALVAAEQMPLSAKITVPREAVGVEGSSVYLTEGEVFTLEELLCCTLLESANDAAVAVAMAVSGSVEAFSVLMNESAPSSVLSTLISQIRTDLTMRCITRPRESLASLPRRLSRTRLCARYSLHIK